MPLVESFVSWWERGQEMLRIEKESNGCVTQLLLIGRIQLDNIACIRSALDNRCTRQILDLGEVTLVDVAVVRFLIQMRG